MKENNKNFVISTILHIVVKSFIVLMLLIQIPSTKAASLPFSPLFPPLAAGKLNNSNDENNLKSPMTVGLDRFPSLSTVNEELFGKASRNAVEQMAATGNWTRTHRMLAFRMLEHAEEMLENYLKLRVAFVDWQKAIQTLYSKLEIVLGGNNSTKNLLMGAVLEKEASFTWGIWGPMNNDLRVEILDESIDKTKEGLASPWQFMEAVNQIAKEPKAFEMLEYYDQFLQEHIKLTKTFSEKASHAKALDSIPNETLSQLFVETDFLELLAALSSEETSKKNPPLVSEVISTLSSEQRQALKFLVTNQTLFASTKGKRLLERLSSFSDSDTDNNLPSLSSDSSSFRLSIVRFKQEQDLVASSPRPPRNDDVSKSAFERRAQEAPLDYKYDDLVSETVQKEDEKEVKEVAQKKDVWDEESLLNRFSKQNIFISSSKDQINEYEKGNKKKTSPPEENLSMVSSFTYPDKYQKKTENVEGNGVRTGGGYLHRGGGRQQFHGGHNAPFSVGAGPVGFFRRG